MTSIWQFLQLTLNWFGSSGYLAVFLLPEAFLFLGVLGFGVFGGGIVVELPGTTFGNPARRIGGTRT
jgi:hypothetical protein